MYVKMMSDENLPDVGNKMFSLFETDSIRFNRDNKGKLYMLLDKIAPGDKDTIVTTIEATGNIYIMNNEGATIESVAYSPVKIHRNPI